MQPTSNQITLAVSERDRDAIAEGLSTGMGAVPESEPSTTSSIQISRYPNGTWADANRVFDVMPLTEVKIVGTTANGEIRRGVLPDGTVVIVRHISSDGAPTIEIQDNNRPSGRPRTTQEIRFGQKR